MYQTVHRKVDVTVFGSGFSFPVQIWIKSSEAGHHNLILPFEICPLVKMSLKTKFPENHISENIIHENHIPRETVPYPCKP